MVRNDYTLSHIQLVVPEHYLQGGAATDLTVPFDGDVDTIETLTPNTKVIGWTYPAATALGTYTLIYGHQGDDGIFEIEHDGTPVVLGGDDSLGYAQTAQDDWVYGTSDIHRTATHVDFSSLLIETKDPVAATTHAIDITTAGDQIRQVMFSRDYRVPMHDRSWNCVRTFASSESESYLKQKYPRFHLRNEYREVAEHFFEWTGLTDAEKRVFDIFFAAFAGNITQPFAMCIINGIPNPPLFLMDCKMLIIDSSSVDIGWKRNREMQRDGLSFTALELIPN